MLNKAIKELMNQRGLAQNVLCVAMGQSESTFSRMFMKDGSDPKASSIELLARRLNVKVSEVYLEKEKLEPVLNRFFYSKKQNKLRMVTPLRGNKVHSLQVYNGKEWVDYSECKSSTESSNWDDVIYLGEFPEWHIKVDGLVQCPDLYKQLCDEAKAESLTGAQND
jgi:transcriptional regulator with XRE-family HTH domain